MILNEFNPAIYPYKLWVMVSNASVEIPKLFFGYDGKEIENIAGDTERLEAFTMPVMDKSKNNYGVLVFFRNKKVMSCTTIAHEASHAAKFLFEHIGADIKDHEPFEYVVGWIAGCCDYCKRNRTK